MHFRRDLGPTAFMLAALLSVSVAVPIVLPPRKTTPDEYADPNPDPLPREGPEPDPTWFIPPQSGLLYYKEEQPERIPRCNNRWRMGKKANKKEVWKHTLKRLVE